MTAERLTGEWERLYLGPRIFTCARCGAEYEHDGAYRHAVYECRRDAREKRDARDGRKAMTREDQR